MLPVVSGAPVVAYGSPSLWTFYTLEADTPGADVVFTFTAFSGQVRWTMRGGEAQERDDSGTAHTCPRRAAPQPAVFITSDAKGPQRPSADTPPGLLCGSFDTAITSSTAGTGSAVVGRITILPGDPCYCAPPCLYYAGVGSAVDFSFYSLVSVEGSATTAVGLLDGVPQDGRLAAAASATAQQQQFQVTVVPFSSASATAPALTVTLTQYFGAITLAASWTAPGVAARPTMQNAQYTARVIAGTATLTILQSDAQYLSSCAVPTAPCTLVLSVISASSAAAAFTVLARTNKGAVLNDVSGGQARRQIA